MTDLSQQLDDLIDAFNNSNVTVRDVREDREVQELIGRIYSLVLRPDKFVSHDGMICPRCGGGMRRTKYTKYNCRQDKGACGFLVSRRYSHKSPKTFFDVTQVDGSGNETTIEIRDDDLIVIEFIGGLVKIVKGRIV